MHRVQKRRGQDADRLGTGCLRRFDRGRDLVLMHDPLHREIDAARFDAVLDRLKVSLDCDGPVGQYGDPVDAGQHFGQQLDTLAVQLRGEQADPGEIAAGPRQRFDEARREVIVRRAIMGIECVARAAACIAVSPPQ